MGCGGSQGVATGGAAGAPERSSAAKRPLGEAERPMREPTPDTWATRTGAAPQTVVGPPGMWLEEPEEVTDLTGDEILTLSDGEDNVSLSAGEVSVLPIPSQPPAAALSTQITPVISAAPNKRFELGEQSQQLPAPLPKQQLETAAKLAETRRRFDNQRYRLQASYGSLPDMNAVEPFSGNAVKFGAAERDAAGDEGERFMGLGLNANSGAARGGVQPLAQLPGMPEDDVADLWAAPSNEPDLQQESFNSDDEALMAEILGEA